MNYHKEEDEEEQQEQDDKDDYWEHYMVSFDMLTVQVLVLRWDWLK